MDKKLTVYLLVGPPGSGKSTFGKVLADGVNNTIRVCPDEFRAKFGRGRGGAGGC